MEHAIKKRLESYPVPEFVWDEYHLDQEINDRGILLDMGVVKNAIIFDEKSKEELTAAIIAYGIKKEDVVPAKIGNKIVSAIMIPTDDEELYLSYMRPIWAEMKREERSRRCIVSNGKGSEHALV